jgi:hypothetical protein
VIDIPLLAIFYRFDQPHPHHFQSESTLPTHRNYPFVDLLELKSFYSFYDGLEMIEVLGRSHFINFSEDDLHIDVVSFAPLQKLYIVGLKSVFEIDAHKDLT